MDNRPSDAPLVAAPKIVDRKGTASVFWGLIPMLLLVLAFAGICLDRQWCASAMAPAPCVDKVHRISVMNDVYTCPPGARAEVGENTIICRCPRPDAGVSP